MCSTSHTSANTTALFEGCKQELGCREFALLGRNAEAELRNSLLWASALCHPRVFLAPSMCAVTGRQENSSQWGWPAAGGALHGDVAIGHGGDGLGLPLVILDVFNRNDSERHRDHPTAKAAWKAATAI